MEVALTVHSQNWESFPGNVSGAVVSGAGAGGSPVSAAYIFLPSRVAFLLPAHSASWQGGTELAAPHPESASPPRHTPVEAL